MVLDLKQFRELLETETEKFPRDHPQLIKGLQEKYPHSIKIISNPLIVNYRQDCFLYAFKDNFPNSLLKDFERMLDDNLIVYYQFLEELISEKVMEWHEDRCKDDKVVVYFKEDDATHFGKIDPTIDDMIVSKWGIAHVWRHRIFEVPLSYGDKVKYSNGQLDEVVLRRMIMKYKTTPGYPLLSPSVQPTTK